MLLALGTEVLCEPHFLSITVVFEWCQQVVGYTPAVETLQLS